MTFIEPTKENLRAHLEKLTPDQEPSWGTLTPQHMIEHLINSLRMSRGADHYEVRTPDEKLGDMQAFLFSEKPMPQGIKSKSMPSEGLAELQYPDLEGAKEAFLNEWDLYLDSYRKEPEKQAPHPIFGVLGKEGWDQVHRKHFTHHFLQFGLVGEE